MPLPPRQHRARSLLTLAAVLTLLGLQEIPVATAAQPPKPPKTASTNPRVLTFGVQAATRTKPDSRPRFIYAAVAGARITDYLSVSNYSGAPLSLRLYAGDAFTNTDGGFDLTPSQAKPRDIGSWVTIGTSRLTLAPRTRSILPFRLIVPAGVSPGDHTGGLIASLTTSERNRRGDLVTVEHRLAERIYLNVPGALRPGLAVTQVHPSYAGTSNPFGRGRAGVTYRLSNIGNVRLGARISTTVDNVLGSSRAGAVRTVPELLPGSSLLLSGEGGHLVPLVRAQGRIDVEPLDEGGRAGVAAAPTSASAGFWTVPWSGLALLLVIALSWFVLRRRAQRRPVAGHVKPRRAPAETQVEVH